MNNTPLDALRTELASTGLNSMQCPDDDVLQAMLDVEGGNIQAAARAIVDAQAAENRVTGSPPASDGAASQFNAPAHEVAFYRYSWLVAIFHILSWPLSIIGVILIWCFRMLNRLTPQRPGTNSNILTRYAQDPSSAAREWIETLERETNGSISRDAASMQLTPLPPFTATSYSDALRRIKEEIKILVIIITSRAHSENDTFCQRVLTDPTLVGLLQLPEFLVWGGDIHDREAFRVSMLLESSTYPFVAFIALQPRRSRSRGRIVPHPTVLSRMEGSPHNATSASSICTHITDVLIPRTSAYLDELRRERQHLHMDRELRNEQNRAYEQASRRDHERIMQRRAEAERQQELEQTRTLEEDRRLHHEAQVAAWRSWARVCLVPPEPESDGSSVVRVNVKLPDGRNLQRKFQPSDTLEQVYAYVDTIDTVPPDGEELLPINKVHHTFDFHLVQTYPRRMLSHNHLQSQLQDVEGFGPSANLIVEASIQISESEDDEEEEEND